jgi:Queuine tRNA-ribosyltransferase
MENDSAKQQTQPPSPQSLLVVQIMLHAEDGMVPYVTPDVLQRCFPPLPDDLWCLGIAVNDTCITPISMSDVNSSNRTSATQSSSQIKQQFSTKNTTTATIAKRAKPRGYTFSAKGPYQLDTWLDSYVRIVVPTFDNQTKLQQNHPSELPSITAPASLRLWTSNGRHSIDSAQYTECSTVALRAHHIVPLHDSIFDALVSKEKFSKYKLNLLQRNQCWMEEQRNMLMSQQQNATRNSNNLWLPLAVASDTDFVSSSVDKEHLIWIGEQMNSIGMSTSETEPATPALVAQGIMLIGWHHTRNERLRYSILQSLSDVLDGIVQSPYVVGTMSTYSTRQILELLQFSASRNGHNDASGANSSKNYNPILIGTNLPTIWARTKRCFVVDIDPARTHLSTAPDTTDVSLSPRLDIDGCWDFNPVDNNGSYKHFTEHPFYVDQRPLVKNCSCWTCTTYSRAYLFHLVCSKEILVEILFFIHNFHHLLKIIRTVNEYHKSGDVDKINHLCQTIQTQLEPFEETNA